MNRFCKRLFQNTRILHYRVEKRIIVSLIKKHGCILLYIVRNYRTLMYLTMYGRYFFTLLLTKRLKTNDLKSSTIKFNFYNITIIII